MPLNTHEQEFVADGAQNASPVASDPTDFQALHIDGVHLAAELPWVPRVKTSNTFPERCHKLRAALMRVLAAVSSSTGALSTSPDARWIRDNESLIYSELSGVGGDLKSYRRLPHVHTSKGENVPRVLALAEGFLKSTSYHFCEKELASFCFGFQENAPLDLREFEALVSTLKLVLLEEIAERGKRLMNAPDGDTVDMGVVVQSLREAVQISWQEILEPLILFDRVLRQDPAGVYSDMDFESRDLYRKKLSKIAAQSDLSEMEVANAALALALEAHSRNYANPRIALRESHIGYYLVAEGTEPLFRRINFRPNVIQRVRIWLRRHPDEFFMPGIALLTCLIVTVCLLFVTSRDSSLGFTLLSALLLLLPSSQSAVQIIDYLIAALLPAEIIPRLISPKQCPTIA